MSIMELRKALDEVEAVVWATCEFGSIGREKMNVLVNKFAVFRQSLEGKVIVDREQLEDHKKQCKELYDELSSSDVANYLLILSGQAANRVHQWLLETETQSK